MNVKRLAEILRQPHSCVRAAGELRAFDGYTATMKRKTAAELLAELAPDPDWADSLAAELVR